MRIKFQIIKKGELIYIFSLFNILECQQMMQKEHKNSIKRFLKGIGKNGVILKIPKKTIDTLKQKTIMEMPVSEVGGWNVSHLIVKL